MKNLLLINMGRQYGGVEKVVEQICFGIDKKQFNIHVSCVEDSQFFYSINKHNDMFNNKVNICKLPHGKKKIYSIFKTIHKCIKENNIQLIHCHGITSSFFGSIVGKALKVPVITTVHGMADADRNFGVKGWIFKQIENKLISLNYRYIAVSKFIKNELVKRNIPSQKIDVVYNGVEDTKVIDVNNGFSKFSIINAGRLTKIKGQEYLIEAVKILKDSGLDISCSIYGDGELKDYLNNKIKTLNLEDDIKILGFKENIEEELVKFNCLVVSSVMESLGLVILEGFKNKVPVIAPNIGGIREIIDGNNGLLYKCMDVYDLAEKIKWMYENKNHLDDIRENAFRDFNEKWSQRVFIDNITEYYLEVIDNNKGGVFDEKYTSSK